MAERETKYQFQGISTKVAAAGGGSALATVVAWIIEVTAKVEMPVAVAGSLGVLFTLAFGFLTPEKTEVKEVEVPPK